MAKKTREDFTDAEIKKVHSELEGLDTVEARSAVYKKHDASRQAFSNWFHVLGLSQLSEAKALAAAGPKRGVGRPKGSGKGSSKSSGKGNTTVARKVRGKGKAKKDTAASRATSPSTKGTGAKRGRPVGSGRPKGLGLSNEAKETLLRLLYDQTAMLRRLLEE